MQNRGNYAKCTVLDTGKGPDKPHIYSTSTYCNSCYVCAPVQDRKIQYILFVHNTFLWKENIHISELLLFQNKCILKNTTLYM